MSWKPEFAEKIKDNAGRIYIIVSRAPDSDTNRGVIKKIGKSECRGGMKNTFAFYQGGLGGSPSIRDIWDSQAYCSRTGDWKLSRNLGYLV